LVAERYLELLCGLPLQLPAVAPNRESVRHLFPILLKDRDQVIAALEARGIQCGLHYPIPLHLQDAYKDLGYKPGDFPVSERVGRECLSLPLYAELTTELQDVVVAALTDVLRGEEWK
jgi:dTDP-4-amino-4,6-dideoxygalactose transaminase